MPPVSSPAASRSWRGRRGVLAAASALVLVAAASVTFHANAAIPETPAGFTLVFSDDFDAAEGSLPSGEWIMDLGHRLKRNNNADETIRRRYGTPREINRLFVAMLKAAGMDARVAELTTRDENFFHRSFADAFQFNSEVTAVIARNSSVQFYDPGTPYCPHGILSWEKEGVTALVYDRRDARFVETPVTDTAIDDKTAKLTIAAFADGRAEVRTETKLTGQQALELRNELIGLVPEEQRKLALRPARNLLPQASIDESSVALSNLTNLGAPVELKYNFTAPQFVTRAGSRLLLRPLLLSRTGTRA